MKSVFFFRLKDLPDRSQFLHLGLSSFPQLLRLDITPMTASSSPLSLDPARLIAFPPSSLDQLVVVTSGARLLKLSASSGQLLSEVGVAFIKQTRPCTFYSRPQA